MSSPIIHVEGLSKKYRIGVLERCDTFREALTNMARAPFRRLSQLGNSLPLEETIWALKDVSFEVQAGEVLGIIGRNGAGKTTLLKILSQITEPTQGRAEIRGRVRSLLEVGTGFHPELTGRENIYLNGAILGMKKAEIDRKFDEIVAFAKIEKFLDTPVKRYSSGMYVRLAFAIAAHLEPDILMIDEVLSVGDLAFREKCFRHMRTLRETGVTILVVSHYLAQVSVLTRRCVWLDYGRIRRIGGTDEVLAAYANETTLENGSNSGIRPKGNQESAGKIEFAAVRTVDSNGKPCSHFEMGQDITFEFDVRVHEPVRRPRFSMCIYTRDAVKVLNLSTRLQRNTLAEVVERDGTIRLRLPAPPFLASDYTLDAGISSDESHSNDYAAWPDCHGFSVLVPEIPNANYLVYTDALHGTGVIRWEGEWLLPWK